MTTQIFTKNGTPLQMCYDRPFVFPRRISLREVTEMLVEMFGANRLSKHEFKNQGVIAFYLGDIHIESYIKKDKRSVAFYE